MCHSASGSRAFRPHPPALILAVLPSILDIGLSHRRRERCGYVLNKTDTHARKVQHEVVLGIQTATSELSPPFWAGCVGFNPALRHKARMYAEIRHFRCSGWTAADCLFPHGSANTRDTICLRTDAF